MGRREAALEGEGVEDLELKTRMELRGALGSWGDAPGFSAGSESDGPAGVAVGSVTISGGLLGCHPRNAWERGGQGTGL